MGARIGDVLLNAVYSEKPERSVKTTDHPIEGGGSIVDHIIKEPFGMPIDGIITGPDSAVRLKRLEYYQNNGIPLTYSCRNGLYGVIIEKFNSVHDASNRQGFRFSMRLKKINIAQAAEVEALKLPARVQVKAVGSKGVQQPATAGVIKNKNGKTPAQLAAENKNHVNGTALDLAQRRLASKGQ